MIGHRKAAPGPSPGEAPPGRATELALALSGACAFLGFYATQPLLPTFQEVFGVGKGAAALTVSAPTVAVALASPFTGVLAARFGHQRVVVTALALLSAPMLLAATSSGIASLVAWRFAQGLVVPFVYAVAVACIAERWPAESVGRAMSALVTGNVVGGFSGRVLSAAALQWAGWRMSFVLLGAVTAAGALAVSRVLPRDRPTPLAARATRRADLGRLLREPRMLATCAVGFNVLFTLVATFTYVTFYLAAPPFRMSVTALSWMFVVYLVGAAVTPFAGRWIDRAGSRRAISTALGGAVLGALLTLVHRVWCIELGLAVTCTAIFVSQAASTAFLRVASPPGSRTDASGLYVCCYYLGGAAGGLLPVAAWHIGGWQACVALIASVQVVTIGLARRFWRSPAAVPLPARPPAAVAVQN